jgi:hypothetical protein
MSKKENNQEEVIVATINGRAYKESELNEQQKILVNELASVESQIRELSTALHKLNRDKDYRIKDFESYNKPEETKDD